MTVAMLTVSLCGDSYCEIRKLSQHEKRKVTKKDGVTGVVKLIYVIKISLGEIAVLPPAGVARREAAPWEQSRNRLSATLKRSLWLTFCFACSSAKIHRPEERLRCL
jgi:hypothetical protein